MKFRTILPLAMALGAIASPAAAQPNPPPPDEPAVRDARMHDDARMHHDARMHGDWAGRPGMGMHGQWRMMRWCRSMGYHRMMRNPRCRWLMHHHGGGMRPM